MSTCENCLFEYYDRYSGIPLSKFSETKTLYMLLLPKILMYCFAKRTGSLSVDDGDGLHFGHNGAVDIPFCGKNTLK